MSIEEAEKLIISQRYSIDVEPKQAYIEIQKVVNKKIKKIREKCTILAIGITQENEIIYMIEHNEKRFYKIKSEIYGNQI